jgi:SAM-dependent methyltransferase
MTDLAAYLKPFGPTNAARMVVRRGASLLVGAMGKYLRGTVLDVGCGNKSKRYLVGASVTDYVGLDHEGSLHDRTQVDILGTAYRIPRPEATFDGIVCTAVLEHLEDPRAALAESFRVLKPGGHAIYTVPLFWYLHEEPRDFYRYTAYGLRYLFELTGYEIIELVPASGFWLTFGSQWSYYVMMLARGPLRPLARCVVAINNLVFPVLDAMDRRMNPLADKFTWMYLVVARKPGPGGTDS